MNDRYDFSEDAIAEKFMTGGKPIMQGLPLAWRRLNRLKNSRQ